MFNGKEEVLQGLIEQWFQKIGLPHKAQQELDTGSRVDLMLCLHQDNPDPWCVVEVKTALSPFKTSVKDLANHFEQCIKYQVTTEMPVFLGPFFIPTMGISEYVSGGAEPRHATAAFSAFAGRVNVGLLFINATPGYENDINYWYGLRMLMRQETVAEWHKDSYSIHNKWPTERIRSVSFSGAASKSVRG